MVNYPLRKGLWFESLDVSKIYLVNILLERSLGKDLVVQ